MARYAATSRFEQEVAKPRGIHVRYLVMGSGSYLYMDERRQMFEDDTYLTAAHSDDWQDTIVNLDDFSTVWEEGADRFNNWPWGLNDLWPYPTQVGAEQIRNQFGSRDVHYLVGEHDLSPSFTFCQERVQGRDTLAKTLLYYRHLEQFYGASLRHRLHVVPDVGHRGRGEMLSDQGLAALFGPTT